MPLIGLAPMEGVLDPLMRKLITQVAKVDYCTTEFIRVTDRLLPDHQFYKYAPELNESSKTDSGTPVLTQLLGGKPDWIAQNALKAKSLGAFGIDLNFGCPARTVNRHDGGASLLKNPERLFNIISEVKNSVGKDFHVSAKVRLGFSDKSLFLEIAQACSEAQATWLTVHARTKEEGYRPPAHWHLIKDMKKVCQIPIFANGDIWSLKDYQKCAEESECTDVMIGRGLVRNPFLAEEIKLNQEFLQEAKEQKIFKLMIKYLEEGRFIYGENVALGRIKQWLKMAAHPSGEIFKKTFEDLKTITKADKAFLILNQQAEAKA